MLEPANVLPTKHPAWPCMCRRLRWRRKAGGGHSRSLQALPSIGYYTQRLKAVYRAVRGPLGAYMFELAASRALLGRPFHACKSVSLHPILTALAGALRGTTACRASTPGAFAAAAVDTGRRPPRQMTVVQGASGKFVNLNVGGTVFKTTLATLQVRGMGACWMAG